MVSRVQVLLAAVCFGTGALAVGGIALVLAGLVVLGAARERPRAGDPRGRVAAGAPAAA